MNEVTYFLIKFDVLNAEEDFQKLTSVLSKHFGSSLTATGSREVSVVTERTQFSLSLPDVTAKQFENTQHAMMVLTCGIDDEEIVEFFRHIGSNFGYRIFSTVRNCFLPEDVRLVDSRQLTLNEKATRVFNIKEFTPLFHYKETLVVYALSKRDHRVHFLNGYLFAYFLTYDVETQETPEFSYPVADDVPTFIALIDQLAIPSLFYEYFRKPLRIMNLSGFNLFQVNRKIFVRPRYYEFHALRQAFVPIAPDEAAIHTMDKIRNGETIETTIRRMLREILKYPGDFLRVLVDSKIEFDRDRDGILTPRILAHIYLPSLEKKPELQAKMQRGWISQSDRQKSIS